MKIDQEILRKKIAECDNRIKILNELLSESIVLGKFRSERMQATIAYFTREIEGEEADKAEWAKFLLPPDEGETKRNAILALCRKLQDWAWYS